MPRILRVLVCTTLLTIFGCKAAAHRPAAAAKSETPSVPAATQPASQPSAEVMPIVERFVSDDGTTVVKLENGLAVIVKPMRSSPVVCVKAFVRAGAMYEKEWLGCGLSHLVEHLVAEGAEQDKATTDDQPQPRRGRIQEIGGQSNAYTSTDQTCYFISATAGKTMACIDLVADWMARPTITPQDFAREHGVVQRELEMKADDPQRMMWEAHATALHGSHPAAVPVIGYPAPLAALTQDDVTRYHRRMYVPQNMVFCVVGDVDVDAVLKRVQQDFAGFNPHRQPSFDLPPVPPLTGVVRSTLTHPQVKETSEFLGFRTVSLFDDDMYTLDVLSYILSEGQSSRLVQQIARQQKLVTAVDTSSWTPHWGQGAFMVTFKCAPEKADAAEKAILAELQRVVAKGVTEEELATAKRQKIADFVYPQQSVESVASQLGNDYLSTGDPAFSKNYTRRIQAVTAEGVQQAAKKYFTFDKMAVTRMTPPQTAADQPAATQPAQATARQVTTFTLPNGLQVILAPDPAVGLVAMAFATKGGLMLEDDATNGLGTLMTALSAKGAGQKSADQIARFFDAAGGKIGGICGRNTFLWQATVLDDSFEKALPIFADVIQHPTYPEKELDILRPMILAAIARSDQDRGSAGLKHFRQKFFADSPYGRMEIGTAKVVQETTPEKIAQWHKDHVLATGSVLAIYGKFDAQKARQTIETLFADLPSGQNNLKIPPSRQVQKNGEVYTLKRPQNESAATILIGLPGMKLDNLDDRFALDILDTIISGYQLPSGWLHDELRGKQLVYSVGAWNWPGLAPGAFMVSAECQPEKAPEVVQIINKNLKRASQYTPTLQEMERAINVILTAELLDKQEMSELATSAALDQLYYGKNLRSELEARYRQVTPADVRRVAGKYLSDPFVLVVVTPQPELFKTP